MKAVFLDSGGVITRLKVPKPTVFFEACRGKGIALSAERAQAAFRVGDALVKSGEDILLSDYPRFRAEYIDVLRKETGLGERMEEMYEEYMRLLQSQRYRTLYEDVLPAVRSIRKAGLQLAVVSNGSRELIPLLFRLGVAPYLDAMVISDLLGYEKPQREIFQVALAALEADPEGAVHVGDNYYVDYLGATRAGIQAYLLDREGVSEREVPTLRSLEELPSALNL